MDKGLIQEVKKKREFSELPDSIVEKALAGCDWNVKESRAFLRKYFGVFLTNKILKGKFSGNDILEIHKSSKGRDYEKVYGKIFLEGREKIVFDLGCGANGFSYKFLEEKIGKFRYVGVEASGQLVNFMNKYFEEQKLDAVAICEDLLNLGDVLKIVEGERGTKIVFLFNVLDALEKFERNYSKKLIEGLFSVEGVERIVISNPVESLSGRKNFAVKRKWLDEFLEENFAILDRFKEGFEDFIIVGPK